MPNASTALSIAMVLTAGSLAMGCKGGEPASCELDVASTSICLESETSIKFCEDDVGGKATDVDEKTCSDLGYTVECSGKVQQESEDSSASLPYWAKSEDDCEAAEGGTFSA